jgi:hypothetical protein
MTTFADVRRAASSRPKVACTPKRAVKILQCTREHKTLFYMHFLISYHRKVVQRSRQTKIIYVDKRVVRRLHHLYWRMEPRLRVASNLESEKDGHMVRATTTLSE